MLSNGVLFGLLNAFLALFLLTIALAHTQLALPSWLGAIAGIGGVLNAVSVIPSMTFSTYHGAARLTVGWGSYISFIVVVAATSVLTATDAPGTKRRARRRHGRMTPTF